MPAAESAARKALEIDPTLAEAHASLGLIRSIYAWEWAEAGQHYRQAIELNPGYVTTHHWYGLDYLGMLGRWEEAFQEIEIALQLDPLSPIIREGKGLLLMLCKRYDEAIEEYRQTLDLDCFFYKGFTGMGRAYAQKGLYEEAITMLQKGRSLSGDIPNILGALGQTYALANRPADARMAGDRRAGTRDVAGGAQRSSRLRRTASRGQVSGGVAEARIRRVHRSVLTRITPAPRQARRAFASAYLLNSATLHCLLVDRRLLEE
jgi:tetratricopeptide (TPR) repeat protein